MPTTTTRRTTLGILGACVLCLPLAACGTGTPADSAPRTPSARTQSAGAQGAADTAFQRLERKYDARLGVRAVDTGTGRGVSYHADERFAYASTHKAFTAAATLRKHQRGGLDKVLNYRKSDLIPNSPVTRRHVGDGMTLRALCSAAIRYSDNTADNLLLRELGGPKAVNADLKDLGDGVTQMNRYEQALNEAAPGDRRDTTTPRAFTKDLQAVALGDGLRAPERSQLNSWMHANPTGRKLIKAGFPDSWSVGDKSGAGQHASRGDIAVVRPPGRPPLVVTVLSRRKEKDAAYDDRLVSEAASVVARKLA